MSCRSRIGRLLAILAAIVFGAGAVGVAPGGQKEPVLRKPKLAMEYAGMCGEPAQQSGRRPHVSGVRSMRD
jgi:hypothetical protein